MPPQATRVRPSRPALNLVSVAEAAALLDRSPRTVRHLAANGTIPAHRIGARTWAIDRASLDTYRHGGAAA
ncbi:helix-turn-helix domain-containing protein [Streptomyces sp. NPDC033538]|uniref:helix-turn-helix domain-containing protein n=1 Tax=Streptomyces sp. NPDC033538 TaxID=3155367 RepID=UPI0033FA6AD0